MTKRNIKSLRVAIYLRVSTHNGQTTENQRRDLEAHAAHAGWKVVAVFEDAGISGTKRRDKRPGLDALLKSAARREFDLVAAWSVDRLGRSLQDLLETLQELHAVGCDLYLHQQALDTTTPSGRALFQMMGVFAEFESEMIKARIHAGLRRAKAKGVKLGRKTGWRIAKRKGQDAIIKLHENGVAGREIARRLNVGRATVQRVLDAHRAA